MSKKNALMSTGGFRDVFPDEYKVRVIFKGFIIARVAHGAPDAMIGALPPNISPCHRPKIQILKLFPAAQPDLERIEVLQLNRPIDLTKDLSLTVSGNPSSRIEVFQQDGRPFSRFDEGHNDHRDFRWFGNLSEMHGITVNVDVGQLIPKLTMNVGVFHTSARSDGEAKITQGNQSTPFGKFALEIAARVVLKPGETASFQNGGNDLDPPISVREADNFLLNIIYDCHCYIGDDGHESDFGLVYPNVITNIPKAQQIKVDRDKARLFSPEVYCTGGFFP